MEGIVIALVALGFLFDVFLRAFIIRARISKLTLMLATLAIFPLKAFAGTDNAATLHNKATEGSTLDKTGTAHNWTGGYWGLNAGYGWSGQAVAFLPAGGRASVTALASGLAPSASFDRSGGLIGLQAGYNWQYKGWVAGIEGDIVLSDISGKGVRIVTPFPGLSWQTNSEQKLRGFSTLRARLGFLPVEHLLIYGTGGLAIGDVREMASTGQSSVVNFTFSGGGTSISCPPFAPCALGSQSRIVTGVVLGGGVEWAVSANVSFKAEYLHLDFGDQNVNMRFVQSTGSPAPGLAAKFNNDGTDIVRLGFNLKY